MKGERDVESNKVQAILTGEFVLTIQFHTSWCRALKKNVNLLNILLFSM
jgi:hypothetical protein